MRTLAAIRSILVPTDFSDESQLAFAHALRIALALRADLDILHVEPDNDQQDWRFGPQVRATLIRWGYLKPGATDADMDALGVRVHRTVRAGKDAVTAILDEIAVSHADLVVMGTHGRTGLAALLQPSVTAPVALKGTVPVLLIPHDGHSFVDPDTGEATLNRILLPVDARPHPAPAFDAANILARALPQDRVELATLHVGSDTVETEWLEPLPSWTVLNWTAQGGVIDNVVHTARTWSADLVVCVTEGRRGPVDALLGSTVERLIRNAPSPVLVVPHEWGTDQIGTT